MSEKETSIKILVVEDNEADYFILKTYFDRINDQPYDITWADTTDKALEYLKEQDFSLCLLDYSISPTETGVEFAKSPDFRKYELPCILLTGFDNLDMSDVSEGSFIYDYLLKDELNPSLLNRSLIYALQRKKAEQDLIVAKQYTSHIISSIPMLIMQTDENGIIRQANPGASLITGFNEEELIGKHLLDIVAPDDLEYAREKAKLRSGGSGNVKLMTKSREERIISWNNFPFDEKHTILIGKDVTLEELEKENEQQRQKMEALGQLAGGVAHEVNNLLQPILLLSEISQDEVTEDPGSVKENLGVILENAERAADIVKDILSFARQEQEVAAPTELVDGIKDAVKFSQDLLPKTISIDIDISPNLENCQTELGKNDLIKIFSNLMINASHAMDSKGNIDISCKKVVVTAKDSGALKLKPDEYGYISVQDFGCGMDKQTLENIFNPFFTTRDIGEGTGLGLSIVYSIIQKNGGAIKAKSKKTQGSTFELYLPIQK